MVSYERGLISVLRYVFSGSKIKKKERIVLTFNTVEASTFFCQSERKTGGGSPSMSLFTVSLSVFFLLLLPNRKKLKLGEGRRKKAGKMRRSANDRNKNDVKNSAGLTVSTDVQIGQ